MSADSCSLPSQVGVRLSGTGGQGLVLAGKLLAEAGAIQCGLNVVYTKSYGPEARGGASRSEVSSPALTCNFSGSGGPIYT